MTAVAWCSATCISHPTPTAILSLPFERSCLTLQLPYPRPLAPPITLLNLISSFLDGQDGSASASQLQPSIVDYLNVRYAVHHTLDSVAVMIRKAQDHVKRVRATEQATKVAEDNYAALQDALANSRQTAAKQAALKRKNAAVITEYKKRKKVKRDKWLGAEERLVDALTELKVKAANMTAQKRIDKQEAKRERQQKREEEKKAIEEKEAAAKAEKQAADEKKKEREEELRQKRRDVQASQSLALKAKAADSEADKQRKARREDAIDDAFLKLLQNLNEEHEERRGKRKRKREEEVESGSDKENIEPADE